MKGVILGINPEARIIDITHSISRHNISEASQVLSTSYGYFPLSSIHIAVVDPRVGGKRRPILVEADGHYFIGPDNGIFTPVLEKAGPGSSKVYHLTASDYFLSMKGSTFHGRDIFAPVAAWLSKGTEPSSFGAPIDDFEKITTPRTSITDDNTIVGEIVAIDGFGNAISNITGDMLSGIGKDRYEINFRTEKPRMTAYYSEAGTSGLHAVINSFGMLELFVFKGNAAKEFDIKIGDSVTVTGL
jgi:S-adenosylmethionine hydrolase